VYLQHIRRCGGTWNTANIDQLLQRNKDFAATCALIRGGSGDPAHRRRITDTRVSLP